MSRWILRILVNSVFAVTLIACEYDDGTNFIMRGNDVSYWNILDYAYRHLYQ